MACILRGPPCPSFDAVIHEDVSVGQGLCHQPVGWWSDFFVLLLLVSRSGPEFVRSSWGVESWFGVAGTSWLRHSMDASARSASVFSVLRGCGVTDWSQSSMASGMVSSRWGWATFPCHCMALFARSHTVLDIVQKVGGDCTHPMAQAMGMPTNWGSPGHFGRMMLSRRLFRARKNRQWNLSLMSCLLACVHRTKLWVGMSDLV